MADEVYDGAGSIELGACHLEHSCVAFYEGAAVEIIANEQGSFTQVDGGMGIGDAGFLID